MSWLVILSGEVKRKRAVAKASLNRANEFDALDPKPGDLGMTRVKVR